jgi:hypothetical protein
MRVDKFIDINKIINNAEIIDGEELYWQGKPDKLVFRNRNIEKIFTHTIATSIACYVFFTIYYLVFDGTYLPYEEHINLGLFTLLIFLVLSISYTYKIITIDSLKYYVTNHRVFITSNTKYLKSISLKIKDINQIKLSSSYSERSNNVKSIRLKLDDDNIYLECLSEWNELYDYLQRKKHHNPIH